MPRTVLIVDDDPDIRDQLSDILSDEGYIVFGAAHGREALDLLQAGLRPSLILLDVVMPLMNGWIFLQVRALDPALRDIPVGLMSAGTPHLTRPFPSGANVAFTLAKPFSLQHLFDVVERFTRDE